MPEKSNMDATAQAATVQAETGANGKAQGGSLIEGLKNLDSLSLEDQLQLATDVEAAATANASKQEQEASATQKTEVKPAEKSAEKSAEAAKEPDKAVDGKTVSKEGDVREENGSVTVRPSRFKKLLAANAEAKAYKAQLDKVMTLLQQRAQGAQQGTESQDGNPANETDPVKVVEARIVKAREAYKAAKESFDVDAEMAATEEMTDAKADLKAMQLESRIQNRAEGASFKDAYDQAEKQFFDVREKMWDEDEGRFPDLKDQDSQLFQAVAVVKQNWFKHKNPIVMHPHVDRLAVNFAAASLGMDFPSVAQVAAVSTQVEKSMQNSPQSNRPQTGAMIKGASAGGSSEKSPEEIGQLILNSAEEDVESVLKNLAPHVRFGK